MEKILEVKNLSVSFEKELVIDDLSFELLAGENLTIIGPNGSGKTVLLKTLLHMNSFRGTIDWAPNAKIGYVPQKVQIDQHLPLNAQTLLRAKTDIMKLPASEISAVARTLDLDAKTLSRPIGHLSGGQFQKCLIAYALLGKPNVLLFDEPTASIDEPREEQIYETLHRLQDEFGLTLVVVSHDLSLVYRHADKVLCLNKQGLCFGAPTKVLTPKVLEDLYGAPHRYYHHLHAHDAHEPG